MIKSNINDWIVCQPSGGSIVTQKHGSLNCQNIKNVATAYSGRVPNGMSGILEDLYFIFSHRFIIILTETPVIVGQLMILAGEVNKITSKESATPVHKSIFVRKETSAFSIVCFIQHNDI